MEIIKLQFGSKFVVKIPREGKGEVFECRTYARIPPPPPPMSKH